MTESAKLNACSLSLNSGSLGLLPLVMLYAPVFKTIFFFFFFFFFRYMGTITGISDLDSVRWPNSNWRSVKVLELFSWHACIHHYNVAFLVLCIWRERILCGFLSSFSVRKCNFEKKNVRKNFGSVFV
jgi:hypothetical protein